MTDREYIELKDGTLSLTRNGDHTVTIVLKETVNEISYDLSDGHFQILIYNDHKGECSLKETGTLRNADAEIRYLELNRYPFTQENTIEVYEGCSLNIRSVYLGVNNKKIRYDLINKGNDSLTNISNNVVALDESDFRMEVIGKIEKQARYAKAHQKSRCLTIGSPKKAEVKPVLLIDNNEVEASHSMSSGTIDEEVLFYMNSRGLSDKEALSLLLRSYLIPDHSFYEGFEMGDEIERSAKEKVDDVCSM